MKVEEQNNWEHHTYHVGDVQLNPIVHKCLLIRFPDGSEWCHDIKWVEETHTCYDRFPTPVRSMVPYVEVDFYGVKCGIKLSLLEVIL